MQRREDFGTFVDARYRPMLRTATLLAGSTASGEDLLQEALLRTYVSWPRIKATAAAESYVRTTMVRLLIRDRRRRWSGEIPTEFIPEPGMAGTVHPVSGPASGVGLGEESTIGVAVRAALRTLPVDQRVAIVLRFYADLTEPQIAIELGVPVGTIKSRIHRGIAALRVSGLLSDEAPGQGQGAGSGRAPNPASSADARPAHAGRTIAP